MPKASTNSQNIQKSEPKENRPTTEPEQTEGPKPKRYSIKSVSFIVAPKILNHGQVGTISNSMEWVQITEGRGDGVFSEIPGVWLTSKTGSGFRVFIPVTSFLQVDYQEAEDIPCGAV